MSVIANTTVISNFAGIGQMVLNGYYSPVTDLAQLLNCEKKYDPEFRDCQDLITLLSIMVIL